MFPEEHPSPRVKQWAGICVDGLPFAGIAFLAATAAAWFGGAWVSAPFFILTGWVVWFFRDPERELPADPRALVSPADGKVIDIRRVPYPRLLEGEATRISVFMSVFNVHVNRSPFGGTVRQVHYNPGKFLAAYAEKSSLDNEQTAVVIDTDRGVPVMFVQIAGLIARRIICRLTPGERVARGERYGLIRFGSRVDIYLPDSVRVQVKVGDRMEAGKTVIGAFK